MLEYLPWSKRVINESVNALSRGVLTSLDIELGGSCSFSCIYCETPDRDKECLINFNKIIEFISTKQFKWIYICGVGEPTHKKNENYLKTILGACYKYGLKCSIFTNLSNIPKWFNEFIENGTLNLVIKFDSLNPETLKQIYGVNEVNTFLENFYSISKLVQKKDNLTNIAASIVPTSLNINEIQKLVSICLELDIFPFLGQLEFSGDAKESFKKLYVKDEVLMILKSKIEEITGENYVIPICPALMSSFHISNENTITVDRRSGLSCHWFWLDEPIVENLCQLTDEVTIQEITNIVFETRKNKLEYFLSLKKDSTNFVFGGCGGNKHDIFSIYCEIAKRIISNGF